MSHKITGADGATLVRFRTAALNVTLLGKHQFEKVAYIDQDPAPDE